MKKAFYFSAFLVCLSFLAPAMAHAVKPKTGQISRAVATLGNLMAAYNGESNANARYTAFAEKADKEGYKKVAVLFRAAAKSEEIHARNHAEVIRRMGSEPKATIETPKVGTTKQNLAAAIKGESYERDTMYPSFIEQAKKDNNKAAVETFTEAMKVEANHTKLYQAALDNLKGWRAGGADFYVCNVCGNTVEVVDFSRCPVCGFPKSKYFKVS